MFLTCSQEIIRGEQPSSDLRPLPQAFITTFVPDGNTAPSALELLATHFAAWAMPTGLHAAYLDRNNMR
eukprot:7489991-Ditylum_brightwellii.AAC.1